MLPFELAIGGRGQTLYLASETPNSSDYRGLEFEGRERWFDDLSYSSQDPTPRGYAGGMAKRQVRCRLVRNVSGVSLLPGRLVFLNDGQGGCRVGGYTTTLAQGKCGVVDEFLPSTGVQNGDCFWLVLEGPCMMYNDIAAAATGHITAGSVVVALTGSTTGATTSGRIMAQDLTGATAVLGNQLQNALGVALSSRTSAETNSTILVDLRAGLGW